MYIFGCFELKFFRVIDERWIVDENKDFDGRG